MLLEESVLGTSVPEALALKGYYQVISAVPDMSVLWWSDWRLTGHWSKAILSLWRVGRFMVLRSRRTQRRRSLSFLPTSSFLPLPARVLLDEVDKSFTTGTSGAWEEEAAGTLSDESALMFLLLATQDPWLEEGYLNLSIRKNFSWDSLAFWLSFESDLQLAHFSHDVPFP